MARLIDRWKKSVVCTRLENNVWLTSFFPAGPIKIASGGEHGKRAKRALFATRSDKKFPCFSRTGRTHALCFVRRMEVAFRSQPENNAYADVFFPYTTYQDCKSDGVEEEEDGESKIGILCNPVRQEIPMLLPHKTDTLFSRLRQIRSFSFCTKNNALLDVFFSRRSSGGMATRRRRPARFVTPEGNGFKLPVEKKRLATRSETFIQVA